MPVGSLAMFMMQVVMMFMLCFLTFLLSSFVVLVQRQEVLESHFHLVVCREFLMYCETGSKRKGCTKGSLEKLLVKEEFDAIASSTLG